MSPAPRAFGQFQYPTPPLVVGLYDLVDKLAEHYARPVQPTTWPQRYDAADVEAVFGAGK
ncbi:hypothetical protein ACFXKX_17985 [Streptomyces scopuliridis]|uniref:hypothetical protein n=1 Tax=Streptomyces scopuliridis TaxID=452529 RepID=UPI00367E49C4